MRLPRLVHPFKLSPKDAVAVQRRLAAAVRLEPLETPRLVLGLDCAFLEQTVLAVGVVWDLEARLIVETRGASRPLEFPYVPGLLSFRELPVLLAVLRRIESPVHVVLCDGQGIAHPRRFGIASHLGVLTGLPTVGCAKSRLTGRHGDPDPERGAAVPLLAQEKGAARDERIGTVLRTRRGVKPVYVSPGHRADFKSSETLVLAAGGGYRLPEPTRLADRLVAEFKRQGRFRGGLRA